MNVKRRFIAKPQFTGRRTIWLVYDTERASWPVLMRPPFGEVKQTIMEADAQAEADRLEALRGE